MIHFGREVDLHHFHPKDTEAVINEFIRQAIENRYPVVSIIHGKGKSVKRAQVCCILENHPDVISCKQDGPNWGALIVYVRI